jgi:hypothetical protein
MLWVVLIVIKFRHKRGDKLIISNSAEPVARIFSKSCSSEFAISPYFYKGIVEVLLLEFL